MISKLISSLFLILLSFFLFFFTSVYSLRIPPLYSNPAVTEDTPNPTTCLSQSLAIKNLTISSTQILKNSPFTSEKSSVSFQLFNAAIGIDAQCSADDIALTPNAIGADPYKWYSCFVESRDPRIYAKFQYDATLNHLTVEEGWVCDDPKEGAKSVQFTASNFEWLDVSCVDKGGSHVECIQPTEGLGSEIYFPIEVEHRDL